MFESVGNLESKSINNKEQSKRNRQGRGRGRGRGRGKAATAATAAAKRKRDQESSEEERGAEADEESGSDKQEKEDETPKAKEPEPSNVQDVVIQEEDEDVQVAEVKLLKTTESKETKDADEKVSSCDVLNNMQTSDSKVKPRPTDLFSFSPIHMHQKVSSKLMKIKKDHVMHMKTAIL